MTEEQAKKTYERAIKMEQEFGEYFTGKYWTSDPESIFNLYTYNTIIVLNANSLQWAVSLIRVEVLV